MHVFAYYSLLLAFAHHSKQSSASLWHILSGEIGCEPNPKPYISVRQVLQVCNTSPKWDVSKDNIGRSTPIRLYLMVFDLFRGHGRVGYFYLYQIDGGYRLVSLPLMCQLDVSCVYSDMQEHCCRFDNGYDGL